MDATRLETDCPSDLDLRDLVLMNWLMNRRIRPRRRSASAASKRIVNFAERLMRGPALGRKSYYGSVAEWSARLATTMFSIFATFKLGKLNPQRCPTWYLEACAQQQGHAPADIQPFLPWNLSADRRAELADPTTSRQTDNS